MCNAIKGARPYILVTQLHAWHGPFETPTNWALIWHAVWISILYAAPPLIAAWLIFRRREAGNMAHHCRIVEFEQCVGAVEPIGLAGKREIVPGAELLELRPADPSRGEAARHPGGAQFLGDGKGFGPGPGRMVGIEPGLLEQILVPINDRRRAVERQ